MQLPNSLLLKIENSKPERITALGNLSKSTKFSPNMAALFLPVFLADVSTLSAQEAIATLALSPQKTILAPAEPKTCGSV